MRKLMVWSLALVLMFMSTSLVACGPKKPTDGTGEENGTKKSVLIPAAEAKDAGDWEYPVVANSGEFGIGETVKLSDVVKNPEVKVVLVDYWATWCEPCKEEMPYLQEIYLANKSKGLCPLVITVDGNEGLKPHIIKSVTNMKWKKDAEGHKGGDPANITYVIPWDIKSESKNLYGITAIPVTMLIDKNNKIRYQHSGFSEELIEDLKVAIDELLAEK
jgi:thiol-disulfide isomerase/thioredoxin